MPATEIYTNRILEFDHSGAMDAERSQVDVMRVACDNDSAAQDGEPSEPRRLLMADYPPTQSIVFADLRQLSEDLKQEWLASLSNSNAA